MGNSKINSKIIFSRNPVGGTFKMGLAITTLEKYF
jgi:hypothetical protein